MTPLERLCGAAHGGAVDRPPCICPGGMMNGVVEDVMLKTGIYWPKAHCDAQMMADLSRALYESGGFENYGVPFCMTVEAEALGAEADMGDCEVEPHVVRPAIASCAEAGRLKPFDVTKGRAAAVIEAVRILKLRSAGVPVIGNITGPVSVAGTLVDMSVFLNDMRKHPGECARLLDIITDALIIYGRAMAEAGADAICVAEPSGTGEILGAKRFREFTVPYINRLLDAIDVPVKIVHICGKLRAVYEELGALHCDAFSFDAIVNAREIRPYIPGKAVMGNVSTHAIGTMPEDKVRGLTRNAREMGVDILAPACGLPLSTPLGNIRAMVEAAKCVGAPQA